MRLARILLLCACAVVCSSASPAQSSDSASVVLLSDIHFNPFPPSDQCATPEGKLLMAHLAGSRPEQWTAEDFRLQRPTTLGQDSGFALMASALHAAHDAAPGARLVIVTGDFLEHGFGDQLRTCFANSSQAQLTHFAAATLEFVVLEVKAAFPQAQIVPVLGNNDTDAGDYQLPSPAFLAELNSFWTNLEKHGGPKHGAGKGRADFSAFSRAGYFTVPLEGWKHVRGIVLNSVLWSSKFSAANVTADPSAQADGDTELEWLQSQLSAAYLAGDKVVVLGHIPPGLDAYATRMARGTRIVTMYRDCGESRAQGGCKDYAHAVPAMLQRFHTTLALAIFGHTHQNEFRVAGDAATGVPLLVVPSVSPIFQNNPSFLVADVGPAFEWKNFQTWALPMSAGTTQWEREFDFDQAYAQTAVNAGSLIAVTKALKATQTTREAFFQRMAAGSQAATVPRRWQDAYLCGLTHLTAETVLPCVAESQLDLPLP